MRKDLQERLDVLKDIFSCENAGTFEDTEDWPELGEPAEPELSEAKEPKPSEPMEPELFLSFDTVKELIFFRLVNTQRHETLLAECPHRTFLDLSQIYRILAGDTVGGVSSVLITHSLMRQWGVGEEELYRLALENTCRLFPPLARSVYAFLKDYFEGDSPVAVSFSSPSAFYADDFFVCTNQLGICGAAVICYPDFLRELSKKYDTDFFVLPSSIHEVILVSRKLSVSGEALVNMVKSVNTAVVSDEEVLSDSVYYYSRTTGEITKYSGQTPG